MSEESLINLWSFIVTALPSLNIMNLNWEMGHNRQAIYMSLIPKVWVLSRSPGSSELIFPGFLLGDWERHRSKCFRAAKVSGRKLDYNKYEGNGFKKKLKVIKKKYLKAIYGFL